MKKFFPDTQLLLLMIILAVTLVATTAISFLVQTNQADDNARSMIIMKINDLESQMKQNRNNLYTLRIESDAQAIAKARAVAYMLAIKPQISSNVKELESIRTSLAIDELNIADKNGIIIGSTTSNALGYNFASDPQSAKFLLAIYYKNFELAQDPQPKGPNKVMIQYAGVSRIDQPGIVQIGYKPDKLSFAMKTSEIGTIASDIRIGKSGSVLVTDMDGTILSNSDGKSSKNNLTQYGIDPEQFRGAEGSFVARFKERENLILFKVYNEHLLIGKLPEDEIYRDRNNTTLIQAITNLLFFAALYFFIAKYIIPATERKTREEMK